MVGVFSRRMASVARVLRTARVVHMVRMAHVSSMVAAWTSSVVVVIVTDHHPARASSSRGPLHLVGQCEPSCTRRGLDV